MKYAISVKWHPSPPNHSKLDIDESYTCSTRLIIACGSLIKSSIRIHVSDFSCNLGHYALVIVELWGHVHGLRTTSRLSFSLIIVRMNYLNAVNMIISDSTCVSLKYECYILLVN